MRSVKDNDGLYEKIAVCFLYAISSISLLLLWLSPEKAAVFGTEDGLIENVTALIFVVASIVMATGAVHLISARNTRQLGFFALFVALVLFIFAGEEISWAQRIVGIESSEFIQEHNWQGELNFHNFHTDLFNIAFHYGALLFLIVLPSFCTRITSALNKTPRLTTLKHFVAPAWITAPSFIFLGMLDSRFIFAVEKPWAAVLYLLALAVGFMLLAVQLIECIRLRNVAHMSRLLLSLTLICFGILISYTYAVDQQATNIISEYKELVIACGLLVFSIGWFANRGQQTSFISDNHHPRHPNTAQAS